ncbi:hypothetical protein LIER_20694 [Lithospermum erythrorhizon]|uniref:Secreted protein n=1 Tax=Lithospermum erythrorhizon TaxID=34254 RepID=A0AAV3QNT3_LITER
MLLFVGCFLFLYFLQAQSRINCIKVKRIRGSALLLEEKAAIMLALQKEDKFSAGWDVPCVAFVYVTYSLV